jgi:hypothetical protein
MPRTKLRAFNGHRKGLNPSVIALMNNPGIVRKIEHHMNLLSPYWRAWIYPFRYPRRSQDSGRRKTLPAGLFFPCHPRPSY